MESDNSEKNMIFGFIAGRGSLKSTLNLSNEEVAVMRRLWCLWNLGSISAHVFFLVKTIATSEAWVSTVNEILISIQRGRFVRHTGKSSRAFNGSNFVRYLVTKQFVFKLISTANGNIV